MASASFSLRTPTASTMPRNPHTRSHNKLRTGTNLRKPYYWSLACKATSSTSSSFSLSELDLYDLLGIDSSSDQSQIKLAYRSLQKRCHPDIAGPAGHDMAIILNEAYSILSDPSSRFVYDKEQAKTAELRGYTGKPMYSTWFGSESERRAVFVDEVKCVGCLKCALFADKTFAIESVYGRARVVAQWADPEEKIHEAMDACPVNCISIVERSDLPALEFLMSKQPRGNVRIGTGNTVGARTSDVFSEVKVFHRRFEGGLKKSSSPLSKELDPQRARRISAIQSIRSISNWLYWQTPNSSTPPAEACQNLTVTYLRVKSVDEPNIDKLRNAAAARRLSAHSFAATSNSNFSYNDEYWVPSTLVLPSGMNRISTADNASGMGAPPTILDDKRTYERDYDKQEGYPMRSPLSWGIPMGTAVVAAITVGLHGAEGGVRGLEEHVAGSFALEIVNSSWLRVLSAGATWYVIGIAITQILVVLGQWRKESIDE
ncbi:hypothetical protein Nepgr_000744 [Nepenthes gracilis]|uniref:J domain-containing protein n=1 Tax=Nepenthes gracilis TaxID=150966 RepID=A0AAD3P220_NEPGR|nr:hypothetical protein Nepgr_000744 [Nepenthes gracilis]